jgi:hypothetical protein
MVPLAPGLWTRTTGWPRISPALGANILDIIDEPPPAPQPITKLIGLSGKFSPALRTPTVVPDRTIIPIIINDNIPFFLIISSLL